MSSEDAAPLRRAVSYTARLAQQPRLLLAIKTSLAAVLAWYLAPLIPFLDDKYSYYAPLGALVTMYPTVARSARVGVQVLIGLAVGIGLGLCGVAALSFGVPGGVVLGTVIGVGVLLGGLRLLGVGGDWAPLAALFVLLIGGATDPEEFSLSYLGTTAFGVIVGIAVNLLVVPPLYLRQASERLTALRETVTGLLDEAADAVAADAIDPERFERRLETLAETRVAVTADVEEAEESTLVNPRRVRHRDQREENSRRMAALDRSAFLTRDLVDLLLELRAGDASLADTVRSALVRAIRKTADLVATPLGDAAASERLREAGEALAAYQRALGTPVPGSRTEVATGAAIELCLRRIIDVSQDFV